MRFSRKERKGHKERKMKVKKLMVATRCTAMVAALVCVAVVLASTPPIGRCGVSRWYGR